jgi:hypothetical protein
MTLRRFLRALLFLVALPAFGDVDVRLTSPREQFEFGGVVSVVTNDPILRLEGEIRSDGGDILLSIETPAGVPRLDATEIPIRYVVLDLGKAPRNVTELVSTPVIVSERGTERSFGARTFAVSASTDGRTFDAARIVNSPSGVDASDRKSHVSFPSPVRATHLRVEFLDGWQRQTAKPTVPDIRLTDIGVVGDEGSVLPSSVIQVGALFPASAPVEPFRFSVRLKEGRNNLVVTVSQLGRKNAPMERQTDSVTLAATLQPEIPRPTDADEPFVLSDGSHLILTVPPGATDETLRAIRFEQEATETIPVASYATNKAIRAGSRPVLAYRFHGRYQSAFRAEATASLPGQPPSLAVDGRRDFPSTWVSNLAPMPIRWKVNLETAVSLGRIVLYARKDGSVSYAPRQARIRVSSDDVIYAPVVALIGSNAASETLTTFDDATTTIRLPTNPTAQWVELVIEEGKQANNVQVNEIEFYDASGGRVLALTDVARVPFSEPVGVILRYYLEDLAKADVRPDAALGVFLWQETTGEWEWTRVLARPVAGAESNGGYFALDANVLTRLAIFELAGSPAASNAVSARWSHNPFSPNGDGVADTTRLTVDLGTLSAASDAATRPDVSVNLYDLRSMLVKTLSDRAVVSSNALVVEWDGRDRNDRPVPIGPYIYEVVVRRNDGSRNGTTVRNGLLVVAR